MRRIIREEEPPRAEHAAEHAATRCRRSPPTGSTEPAKLSRLVRGELDWIVMKALEKDRNRRYETANGFAADVAAVPGRRAGGGLSAVGRVSLPEVRAAEQGGLGDRRAVVAGCCWSRRAWSAPGRRCGRPGRTRGQRTVGFRAGRPARKLPARDRGRAGPRQGGPSTRKKLNSTGAEQAQEQEANSAGRRWKHNKSPKRLGKRPMSNANWPVSGKCWPGGTCTRRT